MLERRKAQLPESLSAVLLQGDVEQNTRKR